MEKLSRKNQGAEALNLMVEKQSAILLVEDHCIAAKIAKNILSSLNCQIDIAVDGKMALELVEHHPYDLIFMDIGLPDMNGHEVTRRIRTHESVKSKHAPIIALTAHGDSENQQLCLEAGMNAIITKPLRKNEAIDVLTTFVPSRKKWLENRQKYKYAKDNLFKLEGKIIDFDHAKKLLGGNEKIIYEMLAILIDSLPCEIKKLQQAYQQKNWETISSIIHKLKGGASYCGTLRLKSACIKLESYIKSGSGVLFHDLYQQLLSEIAVLQKILSEQNFVG